MSSIKCGNCGLVNFKSQDVCKRCQSALSEAGAAAASMSSLQDEREAAQTSGGVWQDHKKVVLHLSAPLPERCFKCNSSEDVTKKVYTLTHYPVSSLFTMLLVGFARYKKVGIEAGLCAAHRARRRQEKLWGVYMMLAAAVMFFLGIAIEGLFALLIGSFILFAVACIYLAFLGDPLSIAKIKEPYIWLKGADANYLNELPPWRGGQREALY
ncbi:MAG: hypothetical protein QOF02_434 [Blastocatellia bacterium]|jgi:hypothetical protein|nr:hypothetical protein [Blastocatellia bacterium]